MMIFGKKLVLVVTLLSTTSFFKAEVTVVSKENSKKILETKNSVVVIDFYADWCSPCKQMAPIFEEISKKMKGFVFAKANIDNLPELAQEFGVRNIPTVVVLKDGKKLGAIVGGKSATELETEIQLLAQGKGLESFSKEKLQEKLMQAMMAIDLETVRQIISTKGFDINAPFADGGNPLVYAIIFGSQAGDLGIELVTLVLDAGANPADFLTVGGQNMSITDLIKQMHDATKKTLEVQQNIMNLVQKRSEKIQKSTGSKTDAHKAKKS